MTPCRVLVMGASGSGTTTLGRALATRAGHEEWLSTLDVPVARVDTARPVDELVREIGEP